MDSEEVSSRSRWIKRASGEKVEERMGKGEDKKKEKEKVRDGSMHQQFSHPFKTYRDRLKG